MSKHYKYRHGCLHQNSDAESDLSIDFEDQFRDMHMTKDHHSQSKKSNGGRRRVDSNQLSANKSVGGLSRKSRQE